MIKLFNIEKKYWLLIAWVFILVYLIFAFGAIVNKDGLVCEKVEISILADSSNAFLIPEDVEDILQSRKIKLTGELMEDIDAASIEQEILDNTLISRVDVFKTVKGIVKIEVEQREPVARLINTSGKSLYIDKYGKLMPVSKNHTAYVPVIVGHIKFPNKLDQREADDFISKLFDLVRFIREDDFLKAQFGQIYVDSKHELTLYPRVGSQEIYFGEPENYELKFKELMALYEQVFANTGWRKYKAINLKFKGQVVCTKI